MHPAPQAPDQVRSRKELASAGLELRDIDLFERDEALAAMAPKRARDSTRRYELGLPMAIAIDDRTAEIVGTAENGGESSVRTNPRIPLISEIV
jgi:hypothetical protein